MGPTVTLRYVPGWAILLTPAWGGGGGRWETRKNQPSPRMNCCLNGGYERGGRKGGILVPAHARHGWGIHNIPCPSPPCHISIPDSACFKMEKKVHLKVWVKLGCSPRCTKIVPKWHFAGQLAGTDFFNARARGARRAKMFRFSPAANHFTLIVLYLVLTGSGTSMYTARKRDAAWWLGF